MTGRQVKITSDDLRVLITERQAALAEALRRVERSLLPRSLHQARVAARSLRSLLSTLKPLLNAPLGARLHRDLRNLATEFGQLRQADVRRGWLAALADEHGALPAALRRDLAGELESSRAEARRRCRDHMQSLAYAERLERLNGALGNPALVQAPGNLAAILRERLWRRWKRLRRELQARLTDTRPLHRMRLAAKHARYSSEFLMPLLAIDPRHAFRQLKRLQDCLGDYRDAAEALDWLSGLPGPPGPELLLALRQPIRRVMDRRRRELRKLGADFAMPKLSMPA